MRLQRINSPETRLSPGRPNCSPIRSRWLQFAAGRASPARQEDQLVEVREDNGRRPWLRKSRAAALGFGLGATLALSPLVWAENPTATNTPPPVGDAAGETMTSPMALMQHQSFAPLVKKVSPAVVNISVTQSTASDTTAEEPDEGISPGSPNSPFD